MDDDCGKHTLYNKLSSNFPNLENSSIENLSPITNFSALSNKRPINFLFSSLLYNIGQCSIKLKLFPMPKDITP